MPISYLIYTSKATELFTKKALETLWLQAKTNNLQKNITGILLYQEGLFMQLLEGNMDDILSLYNTIQNDPRHICEIPPLIGAKQQRYFSDWSMDFKHLESESSSVPSLNQFLEHMDNLFTKFDKEKADEIQNFIFSYSGWANHQ